MGAQSKMLPKIKSPPIKTKGKWKNGNIAKKMNKKKVLKKVAPKVIAKVVEPKPAQKRWPTLEPAKNAKEAPVKYEDEIEIVKAPKVKNKKTKNVNHQTTNGSNKAKKTKRGPRKSKAKQQKEVRMPRIGQMPHEVKQNESKQFNKSNPWGAAP